MSADAVHSSMSAKQAIKQHNLEEHNHSSHRVSLGQGDPCITLKTEKNQYL